MTSPLTQTEIDTLSQIKSAAFRSILWIALAFVCIPAVPLLLAYLVLDPASDALIFWGGESLGAIIWMAIFLLLYADVRMTHMRRTLTASFVAKSIDSLVESGAVDPPQIIETFYSLASSLFRTGESRLVRKLAHEGWPSERARRYVPYVTWILGVLATDKSPKIRLDELRGAGLHSGWQRQHLSSVMETVERAWADQERTLRHRLRALIPHFSYGALIIAFAATIYGFIIGREWLIPVPLFANLAFAAVVAAVLAWLIHATVKALRGR